MPNLLHQSRCQKQSLQMKPKGWSNPFLLIKVELGRKHGAGVYSLCCQWQVIKQPNNSVCTESLYNLIAYFSVRRSLQYLLYIYTNLQSKQKTTGIPWPCHLSHSLHCLILLFGCLRKREHKVDLLEQALHEPLVRVGRMNAPRDEGFSHFSLSLLLMPNDAWLLLPRFPGSKDWRAYKLMKKICG